MKTIIDKRSAVNPSAAVNPHFFSEPAEQKPYPVEALGAGIAAAARALHGYIGADIVLCCNSLLGWLSFGAQAHADVKLAFGFQSETVRPISLFTLSIAGSGSRKSSVDGAIGELVREAMDSESDGYRERLEEYRQELKDYEDSTKDDRKNLKDASKRGDAAAVEDIRQRIADSRPVKPLDPKRIYEGGDTMEFILMSMMSRHPSQAIITDEGGQFFGGYSMKADAKTATGTRLTQMWDGKIKRSGTAADKRISDAAGGAEPEEIRGRRMTVNISVQAEVVEKFISDEELRKQGLISRFLTVRSEAPAVNAAYGDDRSVFLPGIRAAAELIHKMVAAKHRTNDDGRIYPYQITPFFDDDAREFIGRKVWDGFAATLKHNPAYSEDNPMTQRFMEHFCRIAGVLAVSEYFHAVRDARSYIPPKFNPFTVTLDIAQRAATLAKWYLDESQRVLYGVVTTPDEDYGAALDKWLESRIGGQEPFVFAINDIQRGANRLIRGRDEAVAAVNELLRREIIIPVDGDMNDTGVTFVDAKKRYPGLRFIHVRDIPASKLMAASAVRSTAADLPAAIEAYAMNLKSGRPDLEGEFSLAQCATALAKPEVDVRKAVIALVRAGKLGVVTGLGTPVAMDDVLAENRLDKVFFITRAAAAG